jgi:transcriptional regulator with XRE-family HTH domain
MFTKGKKITKEIGLRLQEVRQQTGLSAREMAVRLKVTTGGYTKNEGGLSIPNIDSLRHLTLDFDISMDWLLFNKGPRFFKKKTERENELEQTVAELTRVEAALRNEIADRDREIVELKGKLPKTPYGESGAIEIIPEVRELLDQMEKDPVFYHRLMLNFQEFKQQKQLPVESGKEPLPGS